MKFQWLKAVFSMLILWSFLLNSVPVRAQGEIVTSEDISGGSSVFVFRKSSKAPQSKFAPKSKPNRSKEQKAKSRQEVKEQTAKIVRPRPKPTPKPTPKTTPKPTPKNGKPTPTPIKNTSPEDASNGLAFGADAILAKNNLTKEDIDKAIATYEQAIKLFPKNEYAKTGLSEALTMKADALPETDADLAIPIYEKAITNDSKNAKAFAGLGSAFETMEQDELAFQNYEKAINLDPQLSALYTPLGINYYQKGEFAKAEDFLTKAVAAGVDGDQTQFLLGLLRYKQVDYDGAIAAFKKAISLNNQFAEAYYYLGEVYDLKKMDNEAFEQYIKATQINPKYAAAWFDLGVAYFNRERYQDAINAYSKSIQFNNANYEAYENLADVYRLLGYNIVIKSKKDADEKKDWYEKAEGSYRTATDQAERNEEAKKNRTGMAELYSKYGFVLGRLSKWNSSIEALNKATSYNPDAFDLTNLGWAYYNASKVDSRNADDKNAPEEKKTESKAQAKSKLEKGRDALQRAVAMDTKSKAAYMNLGVTQNDLGDYSGAIQSMRKCLELQNDWVLAINELGIAFQGSGDLEEAVKNFRRASDLAEKSLSKLRTDLEKGSVTQQLSDALYNLAYTEKQRGNDGEAKKAQAKLRKYNPYMANKLEAVFLNPVKNKVNNEIQKKNPLNKLPKFPY